MRSAEAERANQNESITLAETKDMQSHSYLFEAWSRARGESKVRRNRVWWLQCVATGAHMRACGDRCTTARR